LLVKVRVIPRAKTTKIEKIGKDHLKVHLVSPPTDGRANDELIEVLARYYDRRKSAIKIKKGLRSRDKIIEVRE